MGEQTWGTLNEDGEQRLVNPNRVKPDIVAVFEYNGGQMPHFIKDDGLKVSCPFHGRDTNPSAIINVNRQYFTCFTCDARGDSWSLIMEHEGLSFPEAMRFAVEQGWLDVADDGVTLTGGHEADHNPAPARGRRKTRKRRKRK